MIAFLQRFNVGHRLAVAFGILILLSGLLVATGLSTMANARAQLDFIVLDRTAKIQVGNGMLDANSSLLIALGTYAMATSEELNAEALNTIKDQRQRYQDLRTKLDTLSSSEEGRKIRAEMDERRATSVKFNDEVIALAAKNENAQAQDTLSEKGRPATLAWQEKSVSSSLVKKDRAAKRMPKPSSPWIGASSCSSLAVQPWSWLAAC